MSINQIKNELKRRTLKKEIIRRKPTAEGFLLYVEMIYEYYYKAPFIRAWWHPLLATILIDVLAGKVSHFIISFAPRHRKTDLVVRMFDSYAIGMSRVTVDVKNALKLIYATYGGTLSAKTSTETKSIVESEIYNFIFSEVKIKKDTDQKTDWAIEGNAAFFATSVQGAGTGVGADIYTLDDPIKANEEGSLVVRDGAWNFLKGSVFTRLEGLKSLIIIMQRIHEDDVVGRFMKYAKEHDFLDKVVTLNIPALNREEMMEVKANSELRYTATSKVALINSSKNELSINWDWEETTGHPPRKMKPNGHCSLQEKETLVIFNFHDWDIELRVSFEETYTYKDFRIIRPPYTPLDQNLFNREELEEKRKDAYTWQTQYLQDPKPTKVGFFKEEWMQWVYPHEVPQGARYITIDPAESLDSSADNRAIALCSKSETYDKTVKTFVEDGRCGLWNPYEFCHHIFRFGVQYSDAQVYIERAGGGITLSSVLPQELLKFNAKQQADGLPQFTNAINWRTPSNQVSKNQVINLMQFPLSQHALVFNVLMDENFKNQTKKEFNAYNPNKPDNDDDNLDAISKSYFYKECVPKPSVKIKTKSVRRGKRRKDKVWRI
jgi:hypothetical protein